MKKTCQTLAGIGFWFNYQKNIKKHHPNGGKVAKNVEFGMFLPYNNIIVYLRKTKRISD